MVNYKILWKTSIFTWTQVLLCTVPLFVPSEAFFGDSPKLNITPIPSDKVNFKIFDNKANDFEGKIYKSTLATRDFFDSKADVALDGLQSIGSSIKALEKAVEVANFIRGLLAEESDWKENFAKTVAHETRREIAFGDLRWIESSMETFRRKFVLMAENNTDMENRKTIASTFHTKIDQMLNFFAHRDSLFKKFPLIGAPLLIEFAELIAFFDPVVKALIPLEARSPEHTCVVHNIMLDYIPRTINARLEKLHLRSIVLDPKKFYETSYILETNLDSRANADYNITLPSEIRCRRGCPFKLTYLGKFRIASEVVGDLCLKDDFGGWYSEYEECILDYADLITYRVEELFPVDLLNKLCDNPLQPTGFGWFTIKLRELRAHMDFADRYCDTFNPCDPFVRMYIDDEFQFQTPSKADTCCYNVDFTYTTGNISKNSMVKLEVWDEDPNEQSTLIIRTIGTIESFLIVGHRSVKLSSNYENSINTVSFWQDDYK